MTFAEAGTMPDRRGFPIGTALIGTLAAYAIFEMATDAVNIVSDITNSNENPYSDWSH
jgi:hypothetical protein